MSETVTVKRTTTNNKDFQSLVDQLDHELWNELLEDQATYDRFNKVPDINTAVVVYDDEEPIAIGCCKMFSNDTVEIKRMFVQKPYRGKSISRLVLSELESWALQEGYRYAVLETSIHFSTAKNLYLSHGYFVIPNYGQYATLEESVCMKKKLQ